MSLWRKEASARLPELQSIIASRDVDNPMMLWIELLFKFQALCKQDPPDLELIKRVWEYAKWSMHQGSDDVATAAALGFCEHLLDRKATCRFLPEIMGRQDYESLKALLLNHNSEEQFVQGLELFEKAKAE
jgi:hypothetical protein